MLSAVLFSSDAAVDQVPVGCLLFTNGAMTNPLFSFFTAFVHMTFGKTFLHGPSGPRSDSRREFPTPEKHFYIFLLLPEHGLYATLHGNSTNRSEKMCHILFG